ncbi:protein RGF1 INDUCIBLE TRANSCRIPTION FACTOR 1-like [Impatiens glandulifera]|uniref:protein RGF1 INDUCIBLE TRANSCRIPTION FACTOR 1-like n=1 Tax=Impatiens glandulifera TaxID=253017 RepID=UPI001FB1860A|nr:protein RGF1 INDUCIBLE TRANSCRIPTION FACTOR 1-like [Impatiens glandulifera]
MEMMAGKSKLAPAWLECLIGEETFFRGCGAHQNLRKNEKNIFCLDCKITFCSHCLSSHPNSHPLLQVRRYVYHNVVRMDDLEKLIACAYIQSYTINNAKVIFLNERPQSIRSGKGSAYICLTCNRILQEPFHFCSLSCKVNYMVHRGEDLSSIIYQFNKSDFTFSRLTDETELSPDDDINDDDDTVKIKPLRINDHSGSRRKGAPRRSPLL